MKQLLNIIRGILAELTDQNAYRRYLAAHQLEACGESWREFQDEQYQAKSRRPRCC
jgi:hypothetical protein